MTVYVDKDYIEFKNNVFYFSEEHQNEIRKLMRGGLSYEDAFNKAMEPWGVKLVKKHGGI